MTEARPEWEKLLAAERHLQTLLPGAVLVGGTAASLHAGHRQSLDGYKGLVAPWNDWDHVLSLGRRLARDLARSVLEGGTS